MDRIAEKHNQPSGDTSSDTAAVRSRTIDRRLIFLISAPRSGSTLLQRMIGSHTAIHTHPEPHLITPLAHLGYYRNVDRAPFDHINSAEALRHFVSNLPGGEADYVDALRAYTNHLYGRMLEGSGDAYFLDKTPAYALVLDVLGRLYPNAKYVVLTRHPLAVFSSYANSFFAGDWEKAYAFNPLLRRYVPAIARLIRAQRPGSVHVRYEQLVASPEDELARVFAYLEVPNEPQAVDYGHHFRGPKGAGDPILVDRNTRPVKTASSWASELRVDLGKRRLAEAMVDELDAADLATWGWTRDEVFAGIEESTGSPKRPPRTFYALKRKVLLALRADIHRRPHGRLIRQIRYYCDVLLRE